MSSVPRRRSVILSDTDYDYHTDYYDVEWIKSNGTGNNNTWIDTNVEMTWDIIVDTKVYGHYTYWDKIFYATQAGGFCEFQSVNQLGGYYGSSVWTYSSGMVRTDTEFSVRMGQGQAKINNSTVILTPTHFATTNHIYLLGNKVDGSVMRMYYCKIYNGTALIRDMIPVKKKSNNEYGFWDLITNKFYGNGGTVALSGGDIILPDQTYYCYYYGDECEEVTGGWQKVWGNGGSESWITVTRNSDNIAIGSTCTGASVDYMVGLQTKKPIDGYGKDVRLFRYAKVSGTNTSPWYHTFAARSATKDLHTTYYERDYHEWKSGYIDTGNTADYALGVGSIIDPTHTSTNWNYDIRLAQTNFGGTTYVKAMGYAFGDDLSGLSAYGDNDTRILGKMEAIMANNTARNYLLKQCSGSLMWACVNNSVFRDAVQRSGHLADFTGHARWSKAMNMAGTWTSKSAHPGAEPLTDFDQLEYISEQNNAFINTKYVPTNTSGFEVVASKSTSDTTSSVLLGSKEYNDSRWFANIVQTVNFGWNTDVTGPSYTANSKVTIKLNYLNDRKMCVNDTQVSTISSTLDAQNKAVAYIFGYNNNGNESSMNVNAKIYSVKISENGQVVKEFIPVRRKSDSEVGMYEKIGGIFYGNISKTTGSTFVAGPKIDPTGEKITFYDYIDITGGGKIPTGTYSDPTKTMNCYIDVEVPDLTHRYSLLNNATDANNCIAFELKTDGTMRTYSRLSGVAVDTNSSVITGLRHKFHLYYTSTTMRMDNYQYTSHKLITNSDTPYTIGSDYRSSASPFNSIRVFSCKIIENNVVVRDLVPAKNNITNKWCLYDKIDEICYYDVGNGTVSGGNLEKAITGYQLLDWIQSNGSAYADLDYKNFDEIKFMADCKFRQTELTPTDKWHFIFGSHPSNDDNYHLMGLGYASSQVAVTRTLRGFGMYTDFQLYFSNIPVGDTELRDGFIEANAFGVNGVMDTTFKTTAKAKSSYTNANSMHIFALSNFVAQSFKGKIYKFKLYNEGKPVIDLAPAKRISDGAYGFYDRIRSRFFSSATSTAFTGGYDEDSYEELEYIESSGTQYIDTGVIAKNTTGFYVMAQKSTNDSADAMVIGSRNGSDGRCWIDIDHSGTNNGAFLLGWNTYTGSPEQRIVVNLSKFTAKVNYLNDRKVIINDAEAEIYSSQLSSTLNTQNTNLYIFGANVSGTGFSFPFTGKIYSIKITDSATVIRNFVPVRRLIDNTICMYDKVSQTFFDNAGTGTFTAGPIKQKSYIPLEYIESTGTQGQFIDMGLKYHSTMSIEGKYTRLAKVDWSGAFVMTTTTTPVLYFPAADANSRDRFDWRRTGYTEQIYYQNYSSFPFTNTVRLDYDSDTLTINGAVVKSGMIAAMGGKSSPYYSDGNMALFDVPWVSTTYAAQRIYYCKIWDNGKLVRSFIPAKRKSDNKICMYEDVSDTFFENGGEGEFIAGPMISEYTELEYIESTGTQYIDTGIKVTTKTVAELDFIPEDITNNKTYFGTFSKISNVYYVFASCGGDAWSGNVAGKYVVSHPNCYTIGSRYKTKLEYVINASKETINDTVYSISSDGCTAYHPSSANNIYVFGLNRYGEPDCTAIKCYRFKIWQNDDLILDLIPVRRTADNIICMYDKVTKTYFENKGTGDFIAGPEREKPTSDKLYTVTDFNAGTFTDAARSGSHSVTSSMYSGTDGFSLIGTPNTIYSSAKWTEMTKWKTSASLYGYSKLTFSTCKVADHGLVKVFIFKPGETTSSVASFTKHYNDLVTGTWYNFEMDISDLDDTYDIYFAGGYSDYSGNTNSQTRYANIKLIV